MPDPIVAARNSRLLIFAITLSSFPRRKLSRRICQAFSLLVTHIHHYAGWGSLSPQLTLAPTRHSAVRSAAKVMISRLPGIWGDNVPPLDFEINRRLEPLKFLCFWRGRYSSAWVSVGWHRLPITPILSSSEPHRFPG